MTIITVTTLSHVLFIRIMLMQVQSVLNKTEPNLVAIIFIDIQIV